MNLGFQIAKRYLFGKKSTNAINLITGISVGGITIGTCALILVLSVFNGFQDLIYSLFNSFNPDLKVIPTTGKVFRVEDEELVELKRIPGITAISQTLEETALFEYRNKRDFGKVKGVDPNYHLVTKIDSVIVEGKNMLNDTSAHFAILGDGIYSSLDANIQDPFYPITAYVPKRNRKKSFGRDPLGSAKREYFYPSAKFRIQQDFDKVYIICPLNMVRNLLGYESEITALEINMDPDSDEALIKSEIRKILGQDFEIKNSYEQEESFLKLMNIEKWIAFAILSLTLMLVAFNLVGALWMIVVDKKKDISILKTMGAKDKLIRNIFLTEGLLISFLGIITGIGLALTIYFLQINFGLIPMREGFIVDSYPISIRRIDFLVVSAAVIVICILASILPAMRADKVGAYIREE